MPNSTHSKHIAIMKTDSQRSSTMLNIKQLASDIVSNFMTRENDTANAYSNRDSSGMVGSKRSSPNRIIPILNKVSPRGKIKQPIISKNQQVFPTFPKGMLAREKSKD